MTRQVHYLKDYQPTDYEVESICLEFDLHPNLTQVINRMKVVPRPGFKGRLVLNGEHIKLLRVAINGQELTAENYQLANGLLSFNTPQDAFDLEIHTQVDPENNTRLEGLYRSGGNYCTQCEAEGFRCITFYPDRPDVLTVFTTKIIAEKTTNSVLLSNGNLIEEGVLADGRHYAVWHDPFPKPSYLFAVVAGNLSCLSDRYQAADGREISLKIYTDERHLEKCHHAMASLKHSMRWDEERFGLIYDLDTYMIVAVDDFNMGAMENKGLNVFNSKYVLADPMTATDADYEGVESVIAHEYFHNWTGNRVTCRDWFQLTLKEGLTVFRDQEFTADQLSPHVKRIEDVRRLRSMQFAEDAGPMAHPIQPQSYVEMNNFYTLTVYEKGAEVVRLYQTLLGKDGFRKGLDLYFKRHDGQAVTVEDFRDAMAAANDTDLLQMQAWYSQAGTPTLTVETHYCANSKTFTLKCRQSIAKSKSFQPLLIPIKLGLYDLKGEMIKLTLAQAGSDAIREESGSLVLLMIEEEQVFVIKGIAQQPTPSLLQGFSAPVRLLYEYTDEQLVHLAHYDQDSFNRWEAIQRLALKELMANVERLQAGKAFVLGSVYRALFATLLVETQDQANDLALLAYALALPDINYLIEQYEQLDIEAVLQAHKTMKITLGQEFARELKEIYQRLNVQQPYEYNQVSIGERLLKNRCLSYLVSTESEEAKTLAIQQFKNQSNMTDVYAALQSLSQLSDEKAEQCLDEFYEIWRSEPLVVDKWFGLQAASERGDVFSRLDNLIKHSDFSYTNPNRVRSVIGVFAHLNLLNFHDVSGCGYRWLADQVLIIDKINPQISSRMVIPITQWKKLDSTRQALMLEQLQRVKTELSSKDLDEIVTKSLTMTTEN